jgi:hypothetical protein
LTENECSLVVFARKGAFFSLQSKEKEQLFEGDRII